MAATWNNLAQSIHFSLTKTLLNVFNYPGTIQEGGRRGVYEGNNPKMSKWGLCPPG